jgi:hypothetical protein
MKKILVHIIFLILFINFSFSLSYSFENLTVGVKKGNWIEYNVFCNGDIPLDHNVTWAKIEVTNIENGLIFVNITSKYSDNRNEIVPSILNIQTGEIGEGFIIPANLSQGDKFLEEFEGIIAINKVEEKTIVNQKRIVVGANTPNTSFYWDQKTGLLVEANTTNTNFSIKTKAIATNIWAKEKFATDLIIISISSALLVTVLITIILYKYKTKK